MMAKPGGRGGLRFIESRNSKRVWSIDPGWAECGDKSYVRTYRARSISAGNATLAEFREP